MRWLVSALVWIGLASSAAAAPAAHPHVLDRAHFLFERTLDEVEVASARLQQDTGVELFVVVEPSLRGRSAREVALDLPVWNSSREQVVLLVALTEREVRIEASPSVSRRVSDREWTNLIQTEIIPRLRTGHNGSAVRAGVDAISGQLTEGSASAPRPGLRGDPRGLRDILFILVAGFLAGVSFSSTRHLKIARGQW